MKNEEVSEKWIKIKYDYVPKYCETCMIQGHNEEQYVVVHPELYLKEKPGQVEGKRVERKQMISKEGNLDVYAAGDAGIIQKPNREEGFVEQ
ncbi:hypothetical protein H5410_000781 [Solanum commersonii]|uniref:Uncharacterized protein n=1 Tax=Solanum commersonii TaxID=4109 RepID=A0A9J6AX63_SOLCO|nr:hypothetical protein H5410_000781 [Solanum commersonii]